MKLIAKKYFVFMKDKERTQAKEGDIVDIASKQEAIQLINAGLAEIYQEPEIEQKITKKGSKDEKIGS